MIDLFDNYIKKQRIVSYGAAFGNRIAREPRGYTLGMVSKAVFAALHAYQTALDASISFQRDSPEAARKMLMGECARKILWLCVCVLLVEGVGFSER